MKKRILSLVLCAAMLLSMCLFLGAGVMDDTTAEGSAESTETVDGVNIVSFTNAGPLVKPEQTVGPAKVRALAANDTGSGVKLDKTVTGPDNAGNYTVRLEAYATGEQTTTVSTKPCDIVLVLDVSGSMNWCIEGGENCKGHYIAATGIDTSKTYYVIYKGKYYEVVYCNGDAFLESNDPGWYYKGYPHTKGNRLTPKSEANPGGAQFYVKEACTSRLSALKTAVGNFIDQVAAKETDGVTHQISIVKFAGTNNNAVGNDKYEDDRYTGGPFNYSQTVKGLTDAKSGKAELKNDVNALTAAGATRADYGMQHAQSILSNRSADRKDATKVVVMFTDGQPTSESKFESSVANGAISAAKQLKDSGATVYTVGCMSDADASRVPDISTLGNTNVNKYMHLVSSNYKDATSMSLPGDPTYPKNENESYYLTAKNADDLKNVFESISQQVGGAGNTKLTRESKLKDAVTPYFEIPAGAEVTLKTANCTGANDDGTLMFPTEAEAPDSVRAEVTGDTVSVTGFDYSANWCGSLKDADGNITYRGQKLIVEFKIRPTADFLGGEDVQTNVGKTDGIYAPEGEKPVEPFTPQQVDVAVRALDVEDASTDIYRGEPTDLKDLVSFSKKLNSTNNEYVTTIYTIKDGEQVLGTYTFEPGAMSGTWSGNTMVAPDVTHTYTVTCKVTSQNDKYTESRDATLTVNVKTCSLTITKNVEGKGANPNQTFVFDVMKDGKVVTTVVLKDNTSTTITGLAVGDYTVVEDTNWSWSYSIVGDNNKTVALSSTNDSDTVNVTNKYNKPNWLTSIVDVINKWTDKDNIDNTGRVPGRGTN